MDKRQKKKNNDQQLPAAQVDMGHGTWDMDVICSIHTVTRVAHSL